MDARSHAGAPARPSTAAVPTYLRGDYYVAIYVRALVLLGIVLGAVSLVTVSAERPAAAAITIRSEVLAVGGAAVDIAGTPAIELHGAFWRQVLAHVVSTGTWWPIALFAIGAGLATAIASVR